jgi:uncharacterized membrane protein
VKRFFKYFLRGLLVLAPLGITAYICWWVFVTVDRLIPAPVPGAGFALTILIVTLIGFLASNLLARSALSVVERVLARLPFVRLLYSSTKDLLNAFVGEKRRFDTPVLVTLLPGGSAKALGFMTQESVARLGVGDHVAVYLPQSYNFAGQVLLFPTEQITRLDAASSEVMAFIVSGGVSGMGTGNGESTGG